jgi:hypothetical protein
MIEDVDEQPAWRANFDLVVEAATKRKKSGASMTMPDIVEAAGVDMADWYKAINKAKREVPDEAREFYEEVLGRKMREPGTTRRASAGDETEAEAEETEEEDDAEDTEEIVEVSAAEVLAAVIDALANYGDDKAGMVRTIKTVAMFYELELGESRPVEAAIAETFKAKRPYNRKKPEPKRRGARA